MTHSDEGILPSEADLPGDFGTGHGESTQNGPFIALESRPFLLFWSTIILSLTGVWVRITAQGWLVYDLTSDEFLLGLVSFCQAAPVLIASPIAGAILDRVDRRKVLLAVQIVVAGAMFILATLVATGLVQVWHIMLIAVVVGTASGFDWPARLSMVPALVDARQLQSAVALNASAFNASRVIGPVLAGVLIATVGVAMCFYLNVAMYLPFILVLATISVDRALPKGEVGKSPFQDRGRVLAVYSMFWGLTPIGALEAGLLATNLGVQTALAINGVIILIYAPLLWRFSPVKSIP